GRGSLGQPDPLLCPPALPDGQGPAHERGSWQRPGRPRRRADAVRRGLSPLAPNRPRGGGELRDGFAARIAEGVISGKWQVVGRTYHLPPTTYHPFLTRCYLRLSLPFSNPRMCRTLLAH